MYTEGSPYLSLIELSDYEAHLISLWHDAGTCGQGGMGLTALSWVEIAAWADRFYSEESLEWVKNPSNRWMPILSKKHSLLDYELQIIHQLSQEYSSEYSDNNPRKECPREILTDEISTADAYAESMRLKESLLSMFGVKKE